MQALWQSDADCSVDPYSKNFRIFVDWRGDSGCFWKANWTTYHFSLQRFNLILRAEYVLIQISDQKGGRQIAFHVREDMWPQTPTKSAERADSLRQSSIEEVAPLGVEVEPHQDVRTTRYLDNTENISCLLFV